MIWRQVLQQAREEAQPFIGAALEHRREHPGLYALAHSYAATEFRAMQIEARMAKQPGRAWAMLQRARWHRLWRRHYMRLAKATAEASQCECMMRKLGEA